MIREAGNTNAFIDLNLTDEKPNQAWFFIIQLHPSTMTVMNMVREATEKLKKPGLTGLTSKGAKTRPILYKDFLFAFSRCSSLRDAMKIMEEDIDVSLQ